MFCVQKKYINKQDKISLSCVTTETAHLLITKVKLIARIL